MLIIAEAEPLSHLLYKYNADNAHTYCRFDFVSESLEKKTYFNSNPVVS